MSEQEYFVPCESLKKLSVGEKVMVNWTPPINAKPAIVERFENGKPLIRLEDSGGVMLIDNREQLRWSATIHAKKGKARGGAA
jgi:hypothetical protein